ncbi:MAG: hypothetical protein AAB506_01945 [Patescibacteria group bacterium]
MVDAAQLVLGLVIVTLTVMLSVIGLQVVYILRELRESIKKMNKVLDDTGVISESVSKPINMFSGMLLGLKGGSALMKIFSKKHE